MHAHTRRQFLLGTASAGLATQLSACGASQHGAEKGAVEQLVNPFGAPWRSAIAMSGIGIASSSCYTLTRPAGTSLVPTSNFEDYANFLNSFSSPYHYDETIAKLTEEMPILRDTIAQLESIGVRKKWIGYSVAYFAESRMMPGYTNMPEEYFAHERSKPKTPENRIRFKDQSSELDAQGYLFDLSNPGMRQYLADQLVSAMNRNRLDALLLDYAIYDHAFGAEFSPILPEDYFEHLLEYQYELFLAIKATAESSGREIILNGATMNGIHNTTWEKVDFFASACHALFWEQPFRLEWRTPDNPGDYFRKLARFASIPNRRDIKMFWKQGSYLMTEPAGNDSSWNGRFPRTNAAKERAYAELFVSMFRILTSGHPDHVLIYSHPIEAFDIYASECYFPVFSEQLGAPVGPALLLADNVIGRAFTSTFLVANFGDSPFLWGEEKIPPLGVLRSRHGIPESQAFEVLTDDFPGSEKTSP